MKNWNFVLAAMAIVAALLVSGFVIAEEPSTDGPEVKATYIGIKSVEAWPQTKDGVEGYAMKHRNGYVTWSPKEPFERAYFMVSDGTGEDAGKITEETVDRFIAGYDSRQVGNRTVASAAKTVIGFDVVETASVAETYAFEQERAKGIAETRAENMVWTFLGFAKQWAEKGLDASEVKEADEVKEVSGAFDTSGIELKPFEQIVSVSGKPIPASPQVIYQWPVRTACTCQASNPHSRPAPRHFRGAGF